MESQSPPATVRIQSERVAAQASVSRQGFRSGCFEEKLRKWVMKHLIWASMALCLLVGACINGPVRYKTIGFRKSLYGEIVRGRSCTIRIAALPVVLIDGVISISDAVAIPVVALPCTYYHGGPDANGCSNFRGWDYALLIFYPFWYLVDVVIFPYADYEFYRENLGQPACWSDDAVKVEEHPSPQASKPE